MKTNEIKNWFSSQSLTTWFMTAAAIALFILFLINKAEIKRQQQDNVQIAVLQNQNDQLHSNIDVLTKQVGGYKAVEDSLVQRIKERDNKIAFLDKKVSVIASNYAIEIARRKTISNDESAALFLKESGCGDIPVVKYDSSYIIPPCPIRAYTEIKTGLDSEKLTNSLLRNKIDEQSNQIIDLKSLASQKDKRISVLDSINSNHKMIEANMNKTLKFEYNLYRTQKIKTWVVGLTEAVIFTTIIFLK